MLFAHLDGKIGGVTKKRLRCGVRGVALHGSGDGGLFVGRRGRGAVRPRGQQLRTVRQHVLERGLGEAAVSGLCRGECSLSAFACPPYHYTLALTRRLAWLSHVSRRAASQQATERSILLSLPCTRSVCVYAACAAIDTIQPGHFVLGLAASVSAVDRRLAPIHCVVLCLLATCVLPARR